MTSYTEVRKKKYQKFIFFVHPSSLVPVSPVSQYVEITLPDKETALYTIYFAYTYQRNEPYFVGGCVESDNNDFFPVRLQR